MEDTYIRLINCRLLLFQSSASSFISRYLLFLKSSRSCVILLPTTFTSVICPSMHHEGGNFFSEYDRSNWLFYLGYNLELSSSLLRSRTCSLVTSLTIVSSTFSFSTIFQSSPNTSAPIFLVCRSLSPMLQT